LTRKKLATFWASEKKSVFNYNFLKVYFSKKETMRGRFGMLIANKLTFNERNNSGL